MINLINRKNSIKLEEVQVDSFYSRFPNLFY